MGHYCYECGEKLVGGVTPTTCECIECYCAGCWDRVFTAKTYVMFPQETYVKKGETFERVTTPLFTESPATPKCPECGIDFSNVYGTGYLNYGESLAEYLAEQEAMAKAAARKAARPAGLDNWVAKSAIAMPQ